jgi:hypothetical protein
MAFPTVNAPYGLKPINLYGGTPFAGATRQYRIASAYDTSIFYGDPVEMVNSGTIIKSAITTARATVTTSQIIGVFLGCSYVNSQGQTIFAQYFPANTAAPTGTYITAYVSNDPDTLFKAVIATGATANDATSGLLPSSTTEFTVIGTNVALVQNSGLTTTGNSRVAVASSATTGTLPMNVVDVVYETSYVNGSGNVVYPELIVRWNFEIHTTTIASGV